MKNALSMAMFSKRPLTPQAVKHQLEFLSDFSGGLLCPDTCSEHEPIRTQFDRDDIGGPISWLAKPHGSFLYKKGKPAVVRGEIWNLEHSANAKAPSPLFCSRWTARFSESWVQRIGEDKLECFVGQLLDITGSDFGLLTPEDDLKAKNTNSTSFSYKGLDLAVGVPGLYCSNFISKDLARWLQVDRLPQGLATFNKLENGGLVLKFSESLSDGRSIEVLRRQSEVIKQIGREKFFDIHEPERQLRSPEW